MRSQNAGLGLKGSSYGASSSDSYKDKLKKLVCVYITSLLLLGFSFVDPITEPVTAHAFYRRMLTLTPQKTKEPN